MSAMMMPTGNIVLVATSNAEFYEEVELTGAYGFANAAEDPVTWGRFDDFIDGTAAVVAEQRFDADVDQYVAEGTWTVGDVVRPFRLVREAGLAHEGEPCHDDAECIDAPARCAPDAGICTTMEASDGDAGSVDHDAGASSVPDAGAPAAMAAGCGCRAASGRDVPAGWLAVLALFALVWRSTGSRRSGEHRRSARRSGDSACTDRPPCEGSVR